MPSNIPEFVAGLQAELDAASSNLGIAQQQVTDLQAKVDQLTSDINTLNGYVTAQTALGAASVGILTTVTVA